MPDGMQRPHPLVVELAQQLVPTEKVEEAAAALRTPEQQDVDSESAYATALANDQGLPELYIFAGFLGGVVNDATDTTHTSWQLLYLDAKLLSWLLVAQDSVLLRKEVDDDTSPAGTRDYVWMKSDASVSRGEGPPQKNEIQARFLRGDFVSAGDFAASLTGGTYAPPTGPSCPLTPGCCGKRTR